MDAYTTVKLIHQTAAVLSIAGFAARGAGALAGAAWLAARPVKILPHVVDTVLLLAGIALAGMLHVKPGEAPWLMAKIAGLLVYIGLGLLALKPGRPRGVRAAAYVGALAVVGWIVSVAITKNPLGYLAGLIS